MLSPSSSILFQSEAQTSVSSFERSVIHNLGAFSIQHLGQFISSYSFHSWFITKATFSVRGLSLWRHPFLQSSSSFHSWFIIWATFCVREWRHEFSDNAEIKVLWNSFAVGGERSTERPIRSPTPYDLGQPGDTSRRQLLPIRTACFWS